ADDLRLATALHEAGERDDEIDLEGVRDLGAAGVVGVWDEDVGPVEPGRDVARPLPPRAPARRVAVVVLQGVVRAAAHRGRAERHLQRAALVVATDDRGLLDVGGPLRIALDVGRDLVTPLDWRLDHGAFRGLLRHRSASSGGILARFCPRTPTWRKGPVARTPHPGAPEAEHRGERAEHERGEGPEGDDRHDDDALGDERADELTADLRRRAAAEEVEAADPDGVGA